jgi:PTH1 family peptidyl-tRNA hydrolase
LYLIVGLGNPGKKYETTRHNIGFWVVDELASKYGLTFGKEERKAQVASGMILGKKVLLAKPQTYMNLSGDSVVALINFYKIDLAQMIVVSDDLDLPLGTVRLRKSGSSGGQNGLKNVIERLGTQEFARVRLGVGRPPGRADPVSYLLNPFKGDDEILAREVSTRAVKALETWLMDGIDLAISRHNGTGEPPPSQKQPVRAMEDGLTAKPPRDEK